MGSGYSNTNLRNCASFDAGPATGTTARLPATFEVSMENRKENDGCNCTQVWGVNYTLGLKKHSRCSLHLKARYSSHSSVESVHFGFVDHSFDDKTDFEVNMKSVCSPPGFVGGMRAVGSCSGAAPVSSTMAKENYATETTVVSYRCSLRDGLFVLQKKKETVNSVRAYMVTLAHYYVTKDIGLSTEATLYINDGRFGIEVKGPFKHPSADLREAIDMTYRTREWSPNAWSHCYRVPNGSMLKAPRESNHKQGKDEEDHKQLIISSIVQAQRHKSIINSSGSTTCYFNQSVLIFIKYDAPVMNNNGQFYGDGNGGAFNGGFNTAKNYHGRISM